MSHIDLHLHSYFSDGTLSPEALVTAAAERKVTLISITDHDEISGVLPAQRAGAALAVEVVSGVEINTRVGREEVHILGYGFSADSAIMHEALHNLRAARQERALQILERLRSMGYLLDHDRVMAIAGVGSIGRPHIARALVQAGYVADMNEAFERLIGNHKPAYVPRQDYKPEMAIALIQRSGGFSSLAHPGKLGDPIRIIEQLVDAGLNALEVYHCDHSTSVTARIRHLATRYALLMTGGSDSHGPNGARTVSIGDVPVPEEVEIAVRAELGRLRANE